MKTNKLILKSAELGLEVQHLKKRMEDALFRKRLFGVFWKIRETMTFHNRLNNMDFGVVVEAPDASTYHFGPEAQGTEKKLDVEDLYYYDKKNTIYFPLNVLREAEIHRYGFHNLLTLIEARTKHNRPVTMDEMISRGDFTEDDKLLLNEFIDELSGVSYDKVAQRSTAVSANEMMSVYQVERALREIFALKKDEYIIGKFKNESHRFSSKGTTIVGMQEHEYYSMAFREYFYRAGSIFIVDSNYRELLPEAVLYSNAKIIFMDFRKQKIDYSMGGGENSGNYRKGTIGLLLAMQHMDLKDKVVVDAGAGNGIVGITAALLGAKKVIILEAYKEYAELIKANAQTNGVLEKLDFSYSGETFQNIHRNFAVDSKQIFVDYIFANIPWWGFPKKLDYVRYDDNLVKILLETFPAKAYIAAGDEYIDRGKEETEALFKRIGLDLIYAIELKGFYEVAPTLILTTSLFDNVQAGRLLKDYTEFEVELSTENIANYLKLIDSSI
ncbi:MAG: 50S ribosomal protein L11 methyltransferase [Candidatus Omnitrophica bacterium]|nr:50S ribosomal protein L11 methyltransferase [Candidatus Omnitrophota bacterium]